MASSVDCNRMFSERILSTPAIFKETLKLFGPQGCSDDKHWVAFWVKFDSDVFFLTNHNSLLCIAINEIALFCIDNRLRQMVFFVFAKVGKDKLSNNWERFWNKKLKLDVFLLYKRNRLPVAVRLFSNRSQRTSKCGETSPLIYNWTDAQQHGIYLFNITVLMLTKVSNKGGALIGAGIGGRLLSYVRIAVNKYKNLIS